jgi:hypothetical protein
MEYIREGSLFIDNVMRSTGLSPTAQSRALTIRVVTRRSYGFRTYEAMEIALYHNLGRLPEPESTHKFC